MSDSLFSDFLTTADPSAERKVTTGGVPRLRCAQRDQAEMRIASLDQLLPPDHQVRLVWDFVVGLDPTPLLESILAVQGHVGRNANDPRLLLALWLQATLDGVGSARVLDQLCREHLAYEWLCGGVSMNYHTLADFRSDHVDVLDRLLTDSVGTLLHEGLVQLERVAQDGMKVRASAGAGSFRREPTLQACLAEAEHQVAALKTQTDETAATATARQQAARQRAARERAERLQQALAERAQLVELRTQQQEEKGVKFNPAEIRTSTTDPEARKMHMPDGGTRPAFNVQFATTTDSGIIVGVAVINSGSDNGQMLPMLDQVEERFGQRPAAMLVDGGFTTLKDIEAAETAEEPTQVYGPIKDEAKKQAKGEDPYQPKRRDGPGVSQWRQRMGTAAAKAIYQERAATAEWVNAGARQRGLYQVRVRGVRKVLAVALLHALAHNLQRAVVLRARAAAGRKA
jgi:transposase